jgi:hypothetical protein
MDKKKKTILILAAVGVAVAGYYLYKKSQAALPAATVNPALNPTATPTSTPATASNGTAVTGETLYVTGNGAVGGQFILPNIKRWGTENTSGAGKAVLYVNINNGNLYWD